MSFNLATMLRESRAAKPGHPLCHIRDLTFSYAQVDEISGRVASALLGTGLSRGDRVAVLAPNTPAALEPVGPGAGDQRAASACTSVRPPLPSAA